MALQATGTSTDASLLFNTGILTINGVNITEIENVEISSSFEGKSTYTLNSVKKKRLKRSNLEDEITFEVNAGVYQTIMAVFNSASSAVSGGVEYTANDGQQSDATVLITVYEDDDQTKAIQYQPLNPLFTQNNKSLSSQEFGTTSVTVMCTEVVIYVADEVS